MLMFKVAGVALFVGSPMLAQQLQPVTDAAYATVDLDEAKLGQLLFYDPILSGNRETACATCHHPSFGTSDGVSLSFGDGAIGLGPDRVPDPNNMPEERIPRNSPALFNLGAREFTVLFHDGRLEEDAASPNGIRTPLGADMALGFASILSAQTMFPVLSRDEMAGSYQENDVARLVRQGRITGDGGAWDILARRVADIDVYADQFSEVYPHINIADDIAFTDISNAIAAFIEFEWRSDTAPFDAHLRGDRPLTNEAARGLDVFYGKGQCADCHAGPFLTDHRNVALTAPYGHAGAHKDLAQFVSDHATPAQSLAQFDRTQVVLPAFEGDDFAVLDDPSQTQAISNAVSVAPVALSSADVAHLVAFLQSLTDPISKTGRLGSPSTVPSGLPVPGHD